MISALVNVQDILGEANRLGCELPSQPNGGRNGNVRGELSRGDAKEGEERRGGKTGAAALGLKHFGSASEGHLAGTAYHIF